MPMTAYRVCDPRKIQKCGSIGRQVWFFGNQNSSVAHNLAVGMAKIA